MRYKKPASTQPKYTLPEISEQEEAEYTAKQTLSEPEPKKTEPTNQSLAPTTTTSILDDPRTLKMGQYIIQGMADYDASILAGFSPDEIEALKKKNDPAFLRFIEQQRLKFKQKHLEVISNKSDAKTSQWMLEKMYPDEFGPKRPGKSGELVDSAAAISAIVREIQRSNNDNLIRDAEYEEKTTVNDKTTRVEEVETSTDLGGTAIL